MSSSGKPFFACVLVLAWGTTDARAETELNAPGQCPYCLGQPELMAASGIVSHGGFEFGSSDTHAIDELLPETDIRWVETPHFELGMGIGGFRVGNSDRKKVRAELEKLAEVLMDVNPKTRQVDAWLQVHLYAQRMEQVWDRFLEIMQVSEDQFPDGKKVWMVGTPYMGEGPYVGQKGKFEAMILPSESTHVTFLSTNFGLQIRRSQRWNVIPRDTMTIAIHTQEDQLRKDEALHGHLAFNLASNLLNGYKHFSYDTPIWLIEGLSHFIERELNPRFNTFDSSEGSLTEATSKANWIPQVKAMIRSGKAPRLAELMRFQSYGDLDIEHHYATWSMTVFLIEQHGQGYACLNDRLHGMKNKQGLQDGSNIADKHRKFFRECLGMSYAQFDKAWAEWALAVE